MLKKYKLLLLLLIILTTGCTTHTTTKLMPVTLPNEALLKSHYTAEIIPHCIIELAPRYDKNVCFISKNEDEHENKYFTLHSRFVESMSKVEVRGAPFVTSPENRFSKRQEAICTLGILRSCALEDLIVKSGSEITPETIMYVVTGEEVEYLVEDNNYYPINYDPKKFEHFELVIKNAIKNKN